MLIIQIKALLPKKNVRLTSLLYNLIFYYQIQSKDYAFKASVAKAYEGYKKEAAKIDEEFEARLFNVALTRLEEAPLRLVDSVNHGSPTHEIVEKTGLNKVGEKIANKVENVIDSITPAKASNDS